MVFDRNHLGSLDRKLIMESAVKKMKKETILPQDQIRLLLVDDHVLVRECIKSVLEEHAEFLVVAEAADGQEAIGLVRETAVDAVIMDLHMPVMGGIAASEQLLADSPDLPIIILSMMESGGYIRKVLKTGVKGYVLKSSILEELVTAIRNAVAGQPYFSEQVKTAVMQDLSGIASHDDLPPSFKHVLTKRELQVLDLILKQYSNNEIADELFISVRTVEAHKRRLLEKTDSRNLVGLTLYAVKNGLLKSA